MFNLTINAVPASTIIVGRRATWLDRHAAEELRDYVKKISGTILNIADETLTMAVTGNRMPAVMNGYSDLMVEIFGHRGQHARAAMGAYVLPGNMPVSVDAIVKIRR